MPFDDEFVEVAGFGGVHGLQGEVVEDEDFDAGEGTHFGFDAVVQSGRLERAEHLIGADEPHRAATANRDVPQGRGQVGLADTGSDGERLQHLRSVLPCDVRVTASTHPLFGELLQASGFKRWSGVMLLVVRLPDGSPGTIRADATDVFASAPVEPTFLVLDDGEGLQALHVLVTTLRQRRSSRGRGK